MPGDETQIYGIAFANGYARALEETKKIDCIKPEVNRLEVIDENGRSYVKYLKDTQKIEYSVQDDDKTLKIFIKEK